MFTGWNKDFGTTNLISTILLWDGFGFNLTQVGTTLWLSQTHGARPTTFYQGWHISGFLLGGAVLHDGIHTAHRQPWIHGKCPVCRAHHFTFDEVDRHWHIQATKFFRKRYGLIPSFNEHIISFFKAFWRGDNTFVKMAAFSIAWLVQWHQHIATIIRKTLKHHIHGFRIGIFTRF